MHKRKSVRDRIRAVEKRVDAIAALLPHLKDCIIVVKILMERGIVTHEQIGEEYQKIYQPDKV